MTSLARLYPSRFIPWPWRLRQPFFAFHLTPHRALATSKDGTFPITRHPLRSASPLARKHEDNEEGARHEQDAGGPQAPHHGYVHAALSPRRPRCAGGWRLSDVLTQLLTPGLGSSSAENMPPPANQSPEEAAATAVVRAPASLPASIGFPEPSRWSANASPGIEAVLLLR